MLLGRICLSIIFILSGVNKFMDPQGNAAYMAAKGMTMVPFFLYSAAILEVVAGLCLFLGLKARYAAGLLLLYLIPVTLLFHDYWNADAASRQLQMLFFFKNLAIFGGLLYAATWGAGGISLDRK
jgi:putative oxidoreductase